MSTDTKARTGADGREEHLPGWQQQDGQSFGDWMDTRVARYDTRQYDWDVLKFQSDFDPKYRRAQMRYMGITTRFHQSISRSRPWSCRPAVKARPISIPMSRKCSSCCVAASG